MKLLTAIIEGMGTVDHVARWQSTSNARIGRSSNVLLYLDPVYDILIDLQDRLMEKTE